LGNGPAVKVMAHAVKVAGYVQVCIDAAKYVDEACQGAPDDRGAASVEHWVQSLGCTSAGP